MNRRTIFWIFETRPSESNSGQVILQRAHFFQFSAIPFLDMHIHTFISIILDFLESCQKGQNHTNTMD